MPDANAINFLALQDAVLGHRFPAASQRPAAKRWLATAYADVWNAADWTFKRVSLSTLAVTSGVEKPTMPTDFGETIALFDQFGDELERMSQQRFETTFAADYASGSLGAPWAFTVVDGRIMLGPKPKVSASFRHSYMRRICHLASDQSTVQAGFMDVDSDYPLWSDHHSVLIPRAQSIGLQELNDPTWQGPQQEYERQLARMEEDHTQLRVGTRARSGVSQWGRN